VAAKLGAPVIRVFSGKKPIGEGNADEAFRRAVAALKECAAHGEKHGVVLAVQAHDDFLKTADDAIQLSNAVGSEWLGAMLDVGGLRGPDPYEEIAKLLPYAVSWQMKDTVWYGSKPAPIDLKRIKAIVERGGYRGFMPFEVVDTKDSREAIRRFVGRIRTDFSLPNPSGPA